MCWGYLRQDSGPVLEANSFRNEGCTASIIPLDGLGGGGYEPCEPGCGLEWEITLSNV
jgi:hypothetical protein